MKILFSLGSFPLSENEPNFTTKLYYTRFFCNLKLIALTLHLIWGEKLCPDFCFLPPTGKAGLGAAGNQLEMQTFAADLNDNGFSLLLYILQNQGNLTVLRMTSVFMACNWKAFEFLQNTIFYVTSKKNISILNTPSLKSVP